MRVARNKPTPGLMRAQLKDTDAASARRRVRGWHVVFWLVVTVPTAVRPGHMRKKYPLNSFMALTLYYRLITVA